MAGQILATSQLRPLVEQYAKSHAKAINQVFHYFGIPALLTAGLGLLALLRWPGFDAPVPLQPNVGLLILIGLTIWYLWSDWRIGLPVLALLAACYWLGCAIPFVGLIGLSAAGIFSHVIGHYCFEGKPPSILSNPRAVLEAPVWIICIWFGWFRDSDHELEFRSKEMAKELKKEEDGPHAKR